MDAVQRASASAVAETLKSICREKGRNIFEAEDFMDDGTRLNLRITIDPETGRADFDFNGTDPQAHGMSTRIIPEKMFQSAKVLIGDSQATGMRPLPSPTRPSSTPSAVSSMPTSH